MRTNVGSNFKTNPNTPKTVYFNANCCPAGFKKLFTGQHTNN